MKAHELYNEIPWNLKEAIGFPYDFDNLTTDQQDFVEEVCFCSSVTIDLKDELTCIKSDLEDVIDNLN